MVRMVNQGDISVWSSATGQVTLSQSDELGAGGEGAVYSLQSHPDLVAKIYHPDRRTDAVINKLGVMINYPPRTEDEQTGHLFVAWPSHFIHENDATGDVIGFLMPKVDKSGSLFEYYNPSLRRRVAPHINYGNLCTAARSLATALDRLHGNGYVVGDINESNAYITDNEHVTLIDSDSFQITDHHTVPPHVYRSLVGKPEYTPPELQGVSFAQVDRNIFHDRFALAVVIYQLLMEGTHPFRGIYTGPGEKPQQETCISNGHFLYSASRTVPLRPVPSAIHWDTLHDDIRALFLRCFDDGHSNPQARPGPRDWVAALDNAMLTIRQCNQNPSHWYFGNQPNCTWCARKLIVNIEAFPDNPGAHTFVPPQPQSQPQLPQTQSQTQQAQPQTQPQTQTQQPQTQPPQTQPQQPQPQTQRRLIPFVWGWISFMLSMILDGLIFLIRRPIRWAMRPPNQIYKIPILVVVALFALWGLSTLSGWLFSLAFLIVGVAMIDRESGVMRMVVANGFRKPPSWINTRQSRFVILRLILALILVVLGVLLLLTEVGTRVALDWPFDAAQGSSPAAVIPVPTSTPANTPTPIPTPTPVPTPIPNNAQGFNAVGFGVPEASMAIRFECPGMPDSPNWQGISALFGDGGNSAPLPHDGAGWTAQAWSLTLYERGHNPEIDWPGDFPEIPGIIDELHENRWKMGIKASWDLPEEGVPVRLMLSMSVMRDGTQQPLNTVHYRHDDAPHPLTVIFADALEAGQVSSDNRDDHVRLFLSAAVKERDSFGSLEDCEVWLFKE